MAATEIYKKLQAVQLELKVPKNQFNKFGGYAYRSKEDILEAAKPICESQGLLLICRDEVEFHESKWVYVKATATVTDIETGDVLSATGLAREQETRKGMDASQITGTAASYAGKRALGNLFAIDDTADADTGFVQKQKAANPQGPFVARCLSCGTRFQFPDTQSFESYKASANCCAAPNWEIE